MNKKENIIDIFCVPWSKNCIGITTEGLGRWSRGKELVLQIREPHVGSSLENWAQWLIPVIPELGM